MKLKPAQSDVAPGHGGVAAHGARHVAIIMDGNGRWAKKRHMPRALGHQRGVEAVRRVFGDTLAGHLGSGLANVFEDNTEIGVVDRDADGVGGGA